MSERVLVIGCGSIGQRHIRNLRALGIEAVFAVDPSREHLIAASRVGAVPCDNLDSALNLQPSAVLICTPPHLHLTGARAALEAGASVFVEKPIAPAMDGVDALLELAERVQGTVYVGYNLRFHAGLRKLKALLDDGAIGKLLILQAEFGQYLPDWRPGRDYRNGYNAHAAMGGGIILDASHEIDYARWLAGEIIAVFAVMAKLSDLEMNVEDTAMVTLRFASGVLGQLHLDCLQRDYARNCKLVGAEGTLLWDYAEGVRLYSSKTKQRETFPLVPDANEMYLEEMRHFLACLRGEATPLVAGGDGKRVLEIALAAKHSCAERREVVI